jgi:hypothetical protein
MNVFGNRTFKDAIRVNEVRKTGLSSSRTGVLIRRGTSIHVHRKGHVRTQKVTMYKPR